MGKKGAPAAAGQAKIRPYTSPTLVLLAMDWPDGANHPDFLGFAIMRSPGFHPGERDGYLTNKISFQPQGPNSQSLPSSVAPIQKFLWWDSAITDADRGTSFEYTVTPVIGTGPIDLALQHQAEATIKVTVPEIKRGGISTWFNRAVVSSQAFAKEFPVPAKDLDKCMQWLANGMQDAIPAVLKGASEINAAIYHLTDKEWVVPALKTFRGKASLVYQDQPNRDTTDRAAIKLLKSPNFNVWPRAKTAIMHDKFVVDVTGKRVLTGSANFTPEGLTSQANLLHIFESPTLAKLYSNRQALISPDPSVATTAKGAAWSAAVNIGKARVRVFFSPEPTNQRVSIDTVVKAVKAAKSSVVFCMFDPTDAALLESLLAVGDQKKLLYGLLNSISDPNASKKKKKTNLAASGEPPAEPSAAAQIRVTLFNRSRKDKKVIAYSYYAKGTAPAGWLPEFTTVNLKSKSTLPPPKPGTKKRGIPAVHIHHKFVVIDADTDSPTIYTGSANLSKNSTNRNDENLLEIKGSAELAQTYFAEFVRLYEHYRARALWNLAHPKSGKGQSASGKSAAALVLKKTRDEWVKGAYRKGTAEYLARTNLVNS